MHGRKKVEGGLSADAEAAVAKKIAKYKALEGLVFTHKRDGATSREALVDNAKLLSVNPDTYSVWNHRREMLIVYVEGVEKKKAEKQAAAAAAAAADEGGKGGEAEAEEEDPVQKVWDAELALTVTGLQKNPKSYCVWHQRRWVVERSDAPLAKELALCTQFLNLDQRNFHCWAYRQWVAEKAGVSPEEELAYTTAKIEENFSNYSAWHYRTFLLPKVGAGLLQYRKELELVLGAVYTEPDDQSAWMYHRWVLTQIAASLAADGADAEEARELLIAELEQCMELWGEEQGCKWPLAAAAYLKKVLGQDASEAFTTLATLDPAHASYYRYASKATQAVGAMGVTQAT